MLIGLAMLAVGATAPGPPRPAADGYYVANQIPKQSVTLDYKKICGTSGFVDPRKLTGQIMVQLEMFTALETMSISEATPHFDGRHCTAGDETANAKEFCSGAIIIQRLILNTYPGYRPRDYEQPTLKLTRDDLKADVTDVTETARLAVARRALVFLNPSAQMGDLPPFDPEAIRCDDYRLEGESALKVAERQDGGKPVIPPTDPKKIADLKSGFPHSDDPYLSGSALGSKLAWAAVRVSKGFNALQWRSVPATLIYRGASDKPEKADPTYIAGQDLFNADKGFNLTWTQSIANTTSKKPGVRKYQTTFQGAVGLPLCVFKYGSKADCPLFASTDPDKVHYFYNVIPYLAIDRDLTKSTRIDPSSTPPDRVIATRQTEAGVVTFLHTDQTKAGCRFPRVFGQETDHCGSFYVLRGYRLDNQVDHSRLDAATFRYVPMLATGHQGIGLKSLDFCVNSVCGDPDRMLRMGLLFDLRMDVGRYDKTGTDPDTLIYNQDYLRVGARAGLQARLNLLPGAPIDLWAAYTDLKPLSGYGEGHKDIAEFQTQAGFTFSNATVAASYRNGRREDTAQRDNTWKITLGFKTK